MAELSFLKLCISSSELLFFSGMCEHAIKVNWSQETDADVTKAGNNNCFVIAFSLHYKTENIIASQVLFWLL